jgi:hypothetical protein
LSYVTDSQVPQVAGLGQDDFLSPFAEPEVSSPFNLDGFLDTVGQAIDLGGAVYSKYVDTDLQNAQLELAKVNADTEAEKARAARLQAEAQKAAAQSAAASPAYPLTPSAPRVPGTVLGIGAGTLALAGVGLGAFLLLRRKRR